VKGAENAARRSGVTGRSSACSRMNRVLSLVLAGVLASGCSPTRIVEQRIAEALPRTVGPADAWDVTVQGLRPRGAARVVAVGTNVRPEPAPAQAGRAPAIERLDLVLTDVTSDGRRLTGVGGTHATATLTTAALTEAIAADGALASPVVLLREPDGLAVRGRPAYDGFVLPIAEVAVEGRLVAGADGTVRLDVQRVRAAGLPLPDVVEREIEARVNPVADLRRTRARLRVMAVRVEGTRLVVEAEADPAALVRR